MRTRNSWMRPGWPWELEVLSLVFALAAAIVPIYVAYLSEPPPVPTLLQQAMGESVRLRLHFIHASDLIWSGWLLAIYVWLMWVSRRGVDLISTPFIHTAAPLFFSFVAYYRLYSVPHASTLNMAIVTSRPGPVIFWAVGVMIIIALLARLRMARCALNFRDIRWDIVTPSLHDPSFTRIALRVLPLVYEPRVYRACNEGIAVEGWFYILVIPFALVQAISQMASPETIPSGHYFATSTTRMIRIQLSEWQGPFFISPRDHDEFFSYCNQHVRRIHRQTTLAGLETAHSLADKEPAAPLT